jgi:predicted nucleotidyltransferase
VNEPQPVAYSDLRRLQVAETSTILRGQVGSGLHGVTVSDQDDRDEMGVCIEPPQYLIGTRDLLGHQHSFEMYQYRTQPEGVRSGPGDLDLTVYSLRKWADLAAKGNPTVLLLLFIPKKELTVITEPGLDLQANAEMFISRRAAYRFIGFLDSQREKLLGNKGYTPNRPELIDKFGFDTKFAYHAIRLGIQGVQLLTEGQITLPMPQPHRRWLTDLRKGKYTLDDALTAIADYRARLERLANTSQWPEYADRRRIDNWLVDTYQQWWDTHEHTRPALRTALVEALVHTKLPCPATSGVRHGANLADARTLADNIIKQITR